MTANMGDFEKKREEILQAHKIELKNKKPKGEFSKLPPYSRKMDNLK
jgi:hypothetical protein